MKKIVILLESKVVNVNVNILRLRCFKRVYKCYCWGFPDNPVMG